MMRANGKRKRKNRKNIYEMKRKKTTSTRTHSAEKTNDAQVAGIYGGHSFTGV